MPKKTTQLADTALVKVALLDDMGIYHGMVEISPDEITDKHLPEITDCDLPPRQHRWDFDKRTFIPLPKRTAEKAVKEPNTLKAIALGFAAVRSSIALPQETLDWLDWYASTMDSQ